jgi:hypothetical protein
VIAGLSGGSLLRGVIAACSACAPMFMIPMTCPVYTCTRRNCSVVLMARLSLLAYSGSVA